MEQAWGQVPGWFGSLADGVQIRVLAHHRLRQSTAKPAGPKRARVVR